MARVHAKRTVAPVRTGAHRHGKTNEQRKPSYKVILEEMTEKKKKLHTTLSFKTEAPPGYTFIAAGDPRLTSKCKEISRTQGLVVYIVSTSRTNSLSEQVGRLGYHFPSTVVEQACQLLGLTMARSGNVHYDEEHFHPHTRRTKRSAQHAHLKGKQASKPRAASAGMEMDQEEINARASFAIRDLFPKIPNQDVEHIVAQAFQKGKSRVGTAVDQPFVRRVHLAVGAYIRHTYTDYDRLLKSHSYLDARAIVQPFTLDKIIEWRDEKDEPDAVEDILREVIVISDDEEDETSHDEVDTDRENSIEIISSHEIASDVQVKLLDYSALDERSRHERPTSPDDDWAPSVKFIRRLSTPPPQTAHRRQGWANRQQAHRNRVWQEAVNRRRNKTQAVPGNTVESPYNRLDVRVPFQHHAQSMDIPRTEHKLWPGHTEARRIHAEDGGAQSSVVVLQKRRNYENEKPNALEALRPSKELAQIPDTPSGRTVTYIPRRRYLIDDVDEVPRPVVRLTSRVSQRPAIAGPVYLEPEKAIPSVEDDPIAHGGQEPRRKGTQPSHLDNLFQDRSAGPRIIELHDDASSPAQKRRRVEDVVTPSSKVMYKYDRDEPSSASMPFRPNHFDGYFFPEATPSSQVQQKRPEYDQSTPRLMDSVPRTNLMRDFAGANPFDGVSHYTSRNTVEEKHATYIPSDTRFEYERHLHPPTSQPQSRRFENIPPETNSRANVSRFMLPSKVPPLHPPSTSSYPSSYMYPSNLTNVARPNESRERIFHEAFVQLKPPEHMEQNGERYAYVRPALDRAYEVSGRIPSSAAGSANYPLESPHQNYKHDQNVIQTSPLRKLDCPEGVRGSSCNRVGDNGFTRMDQLEEHLRMVHNLEPPFWRPAPGQNPFGHTSNTYSDEAHMGRPKNLQRSGYPQRGGNQEVIYIDSSPVLEERQFVLTRRDGAPVVRYGSPAFQHTNERYGGHSDRDDRQLHHDSIGRHQIIRMI